MLLSCMSALLASNEPTDVLGDAAAVPAEDVREVFLQPERGWQKREDDQKGDVAVAWRPVALLRSIDELRKAQLLGQLFRLAAMMGFEN